MSEEDKIKEMLNDISFLLDELELTEYYQDYEAHLRMAKKYNHRRAKYLDE